MIQAIYNNRTYFDLYLSLPFTLQSSAFLLIFTYLSIYSQVKKEKVMCSRFWEKANQHKGHHSNLLECFEPVRQN